MKNKILIVEDNEYKRTRIKELIYSEFPDCDISECYSFTSAWKLISNCKFDLLLLDISLPTFDKTDSDPGGMFRVFGGKELARKIKKRGITTKFLFITQFTSFSNSSSFISFDGLKEELLSHYKEECLGCILYSNTVSEWREELITHIKEL
ncbi:response regulator [Photobacterium damselae]|uniref:Response regulator containing a CheY-like receiver domain and an HD-GYP domain n=1 Tax=Photobacterium damselae TaxID=38293 RepID=A0A2T3Q3R2_PHODM|nr:response regulator [Photobacterium damselae]PSW78321.1 response regulator [Photobacterium damselae]SPY45200.1 Response regulator containing a CheY-like receiver domain and an HD-GYP domain [Photobacterium damselae]